MKPLTTRQDHLRASTSAHQGSHDPKPKSTMHGARSSEKDIAPAPPVPAPIAIAAAIVVDQPSASPVSSANALVKQESASAVIATPTVTSQVGTTAMQGQLAPKTSSAVPAQSESTLASGQAWTGSPYGQQNATVALPAVDPAAGQTTPKDVKPLAVQAHKEADSQSAPASTQQAIQSAASSEASKIASPVQAVAGTKAESVTSGQKFDVPALQDSLGPEAKTTIPNSVADGSSQTATEQSADQSPAPSSNRGSAAGDSAPKGPQRQATKLDLFSLLQNSDGASGAVAPAQQNATPSDSSAQTSFNANASDGSDPKNIGGGLPSNPILNVDVVPAVDQNGAQPPAVAANVGSNKNQVSAVSGSTTSGKSKGIPSSEDGKSSKSSVGDTSAAPQATKADGQSLDPQVNASTTAAPSATAGNGTAAHHDVQSSAAGSTSTVLNSAHSMEAKIDAANKMAGPGTSGINTSQLIQSMNSTSMHVNMRSVEFGDISIRTMVNQQQMTTQISVDDSDLGKAISAHLPNVQAKLVDNFGLHASIEVSQSGMSFSGERGSDAQQGQRYYTPRAQLEGAAGGREPERLPSRPVASIDDAYRIDIRA